MKIEKIIEELAEAIREMGVPVSVLISRGQQTSANPVSAKTPVPVVMVRETDFEELLKTVGLGKLGTLVSDKTTDIGPLIERVKGYAKGHVLLKKDAPGFQACVADWMHDCFGPEISADKLERADRFLEEVLELLQAVGYPRERVRELEGYTYSRPVGELGQEVGGVMVTLAALCSAHNVDMQGEGDRELDRITQPKIMRKIRDKQASKPHGTALPVADISRKLNEGELLPDGRHKAYLQTPSPYSPKKGGQNSDESQITERPSDPKPMTATLPPIDGSRLRVGQLVRPISSRTSYPFDGIVMSVFHDMSGGILYAVQHNDGINTVMVWHEDSLALVSGSPLPPASPDYESHGGSPEPVSPKQPTYAELRDNLRNDLKRDILHGIAGAVSSALDPRTPLIDYSKMAENIVSRHFAASSNVEARFGEDLLKEAAAIADNYVLKAEAKEAPLRLKELRKIARDILALI